MQVRERSAGLHLCASYNWLLHLPTSAQDGLSPLLIAWVMIFFSADLICTCSGSLAALMAQGEGGVVVAADIYIRTLDRQELHMHSLMEIHSQF